MTATDSKAAAAGFSLPAHIIDPAGVIAGWWTDPPGLLLQLTEPARGTTQMAEWIAGPAFDALLRRFPGATNLRVILDMRRMTGRSATARALLMQRALSVARRVGHVVLVPSQQMGPSYLKVVEAAVAALRLSGLDIDIEQTIERPLLAYNVRPAPLATPRPAPRAPL